MSELEERVKPQASFFLSGLGSSLHGFSIAVQLYWPYIIQQVVSQVVVRISHSFIMFFVSVMFVTGPGNWY
jgi:hypothetical protein